MDRRNQGLLAWLALLAAPVWAQDRVPELATIEVRAGRDNAQELRRESTAGKWVIDREELDRQGDASVVDVLKRQPGITLGGAPGRGGMPQMRGMGSYTLVLIDGQPLPPGFSLENLTPSMVERIEISRTPTAETGARAVAGSINIVLRERLRAEPDEWKFGQASEHGRGTTSLDWVHHFQHDEWQGMTTLSWLEGRRADETETQLQRTTADTEVAEQTEAHTVGDRRSLHAMARLQWKPDTRNTWWLTPLLIRAEGQKNGEIWWQRQDRLLGAQQDQAQTDGFSRFAMNRLNGQWNHRFDGDARIEVKWGWGRASYRSGTAQTPQGLWLPTLDEPQRFNDRQWNLSAKWTQLWHENHTLVAGAEWEQRQRDEEGRATTGMDNLHARTARQAVYAQDEWRAGPHWSWQAGLRYERSGVESVLNQDPQRRSTGVWTPLLHTVWKPWADRKDQWRASLTRSYRPPPLSDLIARTSYTRDINSPTAPDRRGNPDLQPELATGVELGFEHYLEGGGVVGLNLFHRRIRDLIRYTTRWDEASQRWLSQPGNWGQATSQGIEWDAKLRLDQLWTEAPRVELRANASWMRSRVAEVPGPDNRLDRQPSFTANLGVDYRWASVPLTLGASVNYNPGYDTRLSAEQTAYTGMKRAVDWYGLWRFSSSTAMRVKLSNAAPFPWVTGKGYRLAGLQESALSTERNWRTLEVRLEWKL